MWNPFKRKQWAASNASETQKEAQEDAKEDLDLGDAKAEDVAGGRDKWQ